MVLGQQNKIESFIIIKMPQIDADRIPLDNYVDDLSDDIDDDIIPSV